MTSTRASPPSTETIMVPVITEHIVKTPETCWGKPRIVGTRIKVEQVVIWHEQMRMSPAEIVSRWPHLTLEDIHAALAYYHDHQEEIDADLAEGDKLFEELKAKQPSILERTRQGKPDAEVDQVPPR